MTRQRFKNVLLQTMEENDLWEPNNVIEDFLSLNFDKDESFADWEQQDFDKFVSSISANGFWGACEENDFCCLEEQDN